MTQYFVIQEDELYLLLEYANYKVTIMELIVLVEHFVQFEALRFRVAINYAKHFYGVSALSDSPLLLYC